MQLDPEVMADLGGPFSEGASREKFDRYRDAWGRDAISRWAVVDGTGKFLGYAGMMARGDAGHPLGPHHEIGWQLHRYAWGKGIASESARRALRHGWSVLEVREIVSHTAPDNLRSQRVMDRLKLRRDASRDLADAIAWIATR